MAKLMPALNRIWGRLDEKSVADASVWTGPYRWLRNSFAGNSARIVGTDNRLNWKRALLRGTSIRVAGSHNLVELGEAARLYDVSIDIRGSNCRLSIGDGCILKGASIELSEDETCLSLGSRSTVTESRLVVTDRRARIQVGADCMIALHSQIRCGDGQTIYDMADGAILNRAEYIEIGDRVWITADCQAMRNIRIGSGSIIASGSVIAEDVPENVVAGGIPARVIKTGISWRRENIARLPPGWFSRAPHRG